MTDKTWTKTEIKAGLVDNPNWVVRGVVAIFNKQTEDEKSSEETKHHNGVGFSAFDAEILSSFAKQIIRWEQGKTRYNQPLSQKQMVLATKRIMKYSGQLAKIANKEI